MKAKQTAIVCWNRFLKCNNTIHQHDHRSSGQTEKNRKKSCNERSIGEAREDLSGKKLIKLLRRNMILMLVAHARAAQVLGNLSHYHRFVFFMISAEQKETH